MSMDRRNFLGGTVAAGATLATTGRALAEAAGLNLPAALPEGVRANAVLDALPGKKPLIKLSYRPPNYETPLEYFRSAITPTDAFFVIAGPCVIENDELNFRVADHLARLAERVPGGIIFKASFEAVPRSLIDAARVDGLSEWRIIVRIMLPLSKSAIATNVILTFIWSWNAFLWPLIVIRTSEMQTLPLGLARFLSVMEDTTGALYAFAVMVLAPSILVFLMAQKEFIRGLTSGATKG